MEKGLKFVKKNSNGTANPASARDWWVQLLKESFGPSFWLFVAFAVLMGVLCYVIEGGAAFHKAAASDVDMLGGTLPRIMAALTLAGFVWVLLPRRYFKQLIGRDSGIKGLVVAAAAGAITPGGPASAYPLLTVMGASGADRGALIAYIVSWAVLAVQRILLWDLPFMGADFSVTRFIVCLPIPIMAGLIARRIPVSFRLIEEPSSQNDVP